MSDQSSTPGATGAIVPRWEWRVFGWGFKEAEAFFAQGDPVDVRDSSEHYLVSDIDANVKIRDGVLDVKVLRETDHTGLQLWVPVVKLGTPAKSTDIEAVLLQLGHEVDLPEGDVETIDDMLETLSVIPGSTWVGVVKRRTRYSVNRCSAEVTRLEAGGHEFLTIAVEGTDRDAIRRTVKDAGLAGYQNSSYVKGLKTLLGQMRPRYAVIDIGTNSVKFHIAERGADGTLKTVVDRAEVTRLGEGLSASGNFIPEAIDRTTQAVVGMVEEARANAVRAIAAVGTAGVRTAANRDVLLDRIEELTGVIVEVISGEEEGRLAYVAVVAGLPGMRGSTVIFDTGGGSSQFTFGVDGRVLEQFSVPVGAVRLTEAFGLDSQVRGGVVEETLHALAGELASIDDRPPPDHLVGMGGAVTNMTAVSLGMSTYDPTVIQGAVLTLAEVKRQMDLYASMDAEGRRSIPGLQPKRAEVILAGACVVRTVMEKLGQTSLTVSDRGLRHGVMAERFGADLV
jgi:exopolyphosphatase/guanosine-5'-triphosphate,3'-diphosphate pyrophosphatase